MNQPAKRAFSVAAIVVASFAAGVILTADFGFTRPSIAQEASADRRAPVASVTVPSFADIADRVMPAVVSITSTEVVKEPARRFHGNDPFEFFFPDPGRQAPQSPQQQQPEERRQVSGGTGFIITEDGYILTNNHVIEGATKIEVVIGQTLDDPGRTMPATIVGRDEATDIALIKVETKEKLPTVKLGDSDRIRVGDWAIAIGNPLQFNNTLTVGVISGRGRSIGISQATTSFEDFIQTDAAINYGNSGGPLLNINGEVIGINTAIRAYAQNIGFATPVNVAKRIYPQLRDKGAVSRGYLGINIRDVEALDAKAFGLPEGSRGVLVEQPVAGKPADKAGILAGDIIVQVDDKVVKRTRDLIDYVSDVGPGVKVKITVYRDGQKKTLTATTAERTDDVAGADEPAPKAEPTRNKIGISVQELTDRTRQMYGVDETLEGIVVTDVKEVSPAGEAGVAVGDVITKARGKKVRTPEDLREVIESLKSGDALPLYVTRGSRAGGPTRSFFRVIEIP
ncbi:MAG: trypsin-like peptidase domain-containing protein [Thermoanaerobaculia bacterium]|nr:trypsin-like peptidase domain-containing protein [Thermoanaerobaculia bacterium]